MYKTDVLTMYWNYCTIIWPELGNICKHRYITTLWNGLQIKPGDFTDCNNFNKLEKQSSDHGYVLFQLIHVNILDFILFWGTVEAMFRIYKHTVMYATQVHGIKRFLTRHKPEYRDIPSLQQNPVSEVPRILPGPKL